MCRGSWTNYGAHFLGVKTVPFFVARCFNILVTSIDQRPPKGATFGCQCECFSAREAHAAWQWWNFCDGRVPHGKSALRINLDETSVCIFQGDQKGNIFVSTKRPRQEPVQKVSQGKRRCCFTHIGVICDRPDLQPLLPQVIIGSEWAFKAGDMGALTVASPQNVHLVRQKSAWNNVEVMRRVVRLLAEAVRPYTHEVQPILFVDASRIHLADSVIAACASAKIWLIVIPAKTTWLLQPCDTHAFQAYKACLKKCYQDARIRSGAVDLDAAQFLPCVYQAILQVLQGKVWSEAFDKDGFGQEQREISSFIKEMLDHNGAVHVSSVMPTQEQLRLCFPARAKVSTTALLRPFLPPRRVLPRSFGARVAARPAPPGPVVAEPRTRLQHRMAEEAKAKAAAKVLPAAKTAPGPLLGRIRLQTAPAPLLGRTRLQTARLALAALEANSGASSSRGP